MKKLQLAFMALLFGAFTMSAQESIKEIQQLQIGDKIPASASAIIMKGVKGQDRSIEGSVKDNGILVLFSCNTCPYVIAWEDRYNIIAANTEAHSIGMVVVNSNEAKRDGADSFEEMKKKAEDFKYGFPYVVDENHVVADALGASKTPDVFLFNSDLVLVYKGAIDDNMEMENVEVTWLANAAMNMVTNKPINPDVTKAVGCTIKRNEKVKIITGY